MDQPTVPGRYEEIDKQTGKKVIRYRTDINYTKEEKQQQRDDFQNNRDDGETFCISDLFSSHGM